MLLLIKLYLMNYHIDIDSYIGYPISKQYIREKLVKQSGKNVNVRINSYGGDVQTALDIRQQFLDHGKVTAYIFGMTASAATILAMGAKKICMSRYALMLLHQCSTEVFTWQQMNADQLSEYARQLNDRTADLSKIDDVMANIYALRSGRSVEEMAEVMKRAAWLTAEEALELGLVDELVEEGEGVTLTADIREHFRACGLPLPTHGVISTTATEDTDKGLLAALRRLFSNQHTHTTMNTLYSRVLALLEIEGIQESNGQLLLSAENLQKMENALAAAEQEKQQHTDSIAALEQEKQQLLATIEELKGADGDNSPKIEGHVDDSPLKYAATAQASFERFKNIL